MIVPTYKCKFCDKETPATMDFSGDMPTGMLSICDCPESRATWEREHRAQVEQRKQALRNSSKNRSIIHVGRTPVPTGRPRHRSR